MNPERSHSRQNSQRLRTIEIRRMAKLTHRPSVQIIHIVLHQVRRQFQWIERTHVLVISLYVSAETLIEITALNDHINVGEQLESCVCFSMASHVKPGNV